MRTRRQIKDRGLRRLLLTALGTCVATSALAGVAEAETLTLGADLTAPKESGTCSPLGGGGCGEMIVTAAAPSVGTRSPVDGTVVRWRIGGTSAMSGYRLNVLHKNTDGSYTVTATSGPVTPSGDEIETLDSALPIRLGEYLELDIPDQGGIAVVSGSSIDSFFTPFQGVGETQFTGESEIPITFGYNADIEADPTPPPPVTPAKQTPPTPIALVAPAPVAEAHCVIPRLKGMKLKAAKRELRGAGCKVGRVRKSNGASARTGRVVKQSPKAGIALATDSKVSVKLS
jgi:hypothetical protein